VTAPQPDPTPIASEYVLLVWLAGVQPVAYGPYTSLNAVQAALTSYTSGDDNAENQAESVGAASIVPLYSPLTIPNQPL
jgi:hypothetical protein